MLFSISAAERVKLEIAATAATMKALASRGLSEPQLVANLVWELPRAIDGLSLGGGTSIRAGGIFVHTQPKVSCTSFPSKSSSSVELGDLLLLRTAISGGKTVSRQALLLQAKKAKKFPLSQVDANQHHLYSKWPAFKYVNAGPRLTKEDRHLVGPDLYDGAKYLVIGPNPKTMALCSLPGFPFWPYIHSCCSIVTAEPITRRLGNYRCFFTDLTDFILGNSGKSFKMPAPKATIGWDQVISDLISETASATTVYMERASRGIKELRGVGCFVVMSSERHMPWASSSTKKFPNVSLVGGGALSSRHIGQLGDNVNDGPPRVPSSWGEGGDSGGISIIEIVVSYD